jgi:hypothetical protein
VGDGQVAEAELHEGSQDRAAALLVGEERQRRLAEPGRGADEDDAADRGLAVVAEVVGDDDAAVGPAAQDRPVQLEAA